MSAELPPVLQRMLDLWNGADVDPGSVYIRDCLTDGGPETFQPEEVTPIVAKFRSAFPDLHWEVEEWFAAGLRYVLRMRASGTHTGTTFGSAIGEAQPMGKPVAFYGLEVFELREDRIVDVWLGWDFGQLYVALGAHI